MKLIQEHSPATEPYYDNASPYKLTVNTEDGKESFSISEGPPEDMTFGRYLSSVFVLPNLIKEAYRAGKRGEDFEMIDKEYNL